MVYGIYNYRQGDMKMMTPEQYTNFLNEIHKIIDIAAEKRDRYVSIYMQPESGISVTVYPWPEVPEVADVNKEDDDMEFFNCK